MIPRASKSPTVGSWLSENGPRELELLFRAIVHHPSEPILIADNDRHNLDASSGAGKLLGLSREQLIGSSFGRLRRAGFQAQNVGAVASLSAKWGAGRHAEPGFAGRKSAGG